ncbi:ABC transporter substrate-binding protein [Streptomyces sp. NPDC059396]|uniref:ABC transporter substrate-binding protein n=1 Tax=Streptomyces sp. NPDC059396 TaxID=3346819 RepID=UPI00368EA72F
MSSQAGIDVQAHVETLIHEFRTSDPLMPVIVLHAEESAQDEQIGKLVKELRLGQEEHGSRVAEVPGQAAQVAGEAVPAARLVRELGEPRRWDSPGALYRRYAFPRLRLVRAINDAVREVDSGASAAPDAERDREQRLLDQLAKQRWRPKPKAGSPWRIGPSLFDTAHVLPASVVAGLAVLLASVELWVALAAVLGILVLLTALNYWLPGRAPIFLWLRRESRWFLTTTFLLPVAGQQPSEVRMLHPVRSWKAIAARANDVAESLREGGQAQLQLHVLALLEDLRDNHRRRSWDLRGLKRIRPPVLFLPGADERGGGIALIKAVSDVRSVRSELDPLLVVASVARNDVYLLDESHSGAPSNPAAPASAGLRDSIRRAHQAWEHGLRAGQSPSMSGAVPWELRIALPTAELRQLEEQRRWCTRAPSRPALARLVWSLPVFSLAGLMIVGLLGYSWWDLRHRYCSAGILTANHDTQLVKGVRGSDECIGIATGGVRFAVEGEGEGEGGSGSGSDGENADADGPPSPADLSTEDSSVPWTLAQVEDRIHAENAKVERNYQGSYVTVVYAGPLSSDPEDGRPPVKGAEELAGVYLAQAAINKENRVKLRVLPANGGLDMSRQRKMADRIAEYAEKDPTVVGVVGLGRDLETSLATADRLVEAGLPVVSGTNSASYLPPQMPNWFSLAAPDNWQAEQLGLLVGQLRTPGKQHAVVLARDTSGSDDLYTDEQAYYGAKMLKKQGFITTVERYQVTVRTASLENQVEGLCAQDTPPSVIYFAGRTEDVGPLMTQLSSRCGDQEISVITGDDLSKAAFGRGADVTKKVTLYHVSLTDLETAAEDDPPFYTNAEDFLPGLQGKDVSYESPFLSNGQTALSHDATQALYEAASRSRSRQPQRLPAEDTSRGLRREPQNRATTWANLRTVKLKSMATGTVDFTEAPVYDERVGHGIALIRVRQGDDGEVERTRLCGRPAGDRTPLTPQACNIRQPDTPE